MHGVVVQPGETHCDVERAPSRVCREGLQISRVHEIDQCLADDRQHDRQATVIRCL